MKKIWKFYLPPVLWAGLIFWNSTRSHVSIPKLGFQNIDKIAHFGVYFILGYLIIRAVAAETQMKIGWKKTLLVILFGALYGASDEIHQLFVPGRSADVADWVADFAGVVSGTSAFLWARGQFKNRKFRSDSVTGAEMEEKSIQ